MHELAVCQDIISQVQQIALDNQAQSVHSIQLEIGPLSGVESPLLKAAFPIASAGTLAENAELIISEMPVKVRCNICNEESEVASNNLVCKQCGTWQTQLISGDEMLLKRIELDT